MATYNYTSIKDMQIVPEAFSQYVIDRSTELNTLVQAGIATPDTVVGQLINGTPEGGRFIQLPMWNPLGGEDEVFGEQEISVDGITTKEARATLLIRQKSWGATDLARVLGGADPMAAIINLIADWRNSREQKVYLSILKGILAPTDGALKAHVNDISAKTGTGATLISTNSTLDTKQLLGDHFESLGMVFMHSMTYTYLQKQAMIESKTVLNSMGQSVEVPFYCGYRVKVDDGMPFCKYAKTTSSASGALKVVADTDTPTATDIKLSDVIKGGLTDVEVGAYVKEISPIYDTYFLGGGAFIRQEGSPAGFVGTETAREAKFARDLLINRWCQVIHPRGLSWVSNGVYTNPNDMYPQNVDLAIPANWELVVDHKKVPIACLRHCIG